MTRRTTSLIVRRRFYSPFPELIQPQHIWPYIQQNLIQQHHSNQLAHRDYHKPLNANEVQLFYGAAAVPGGGTTNGPVADGQAVLSKLGEDNRFAALYGSSGGVDSSGRDNRVIAKPLPNRPTPYLPTGGHAGLNHPHLHSLLTHCRNPYLTAGGEWLETLKPTLNNSNCLSMLAANGPGQMFPLPGPGFPWAHSNRGKPRRGMMRRAVFSGETDRRTSKSFYSLLSLSLCPSSLADSQRKGLEKRFQIQKYISKPDRKKLAERLGLKDSQVSEPATREIELYCKGRSEQSSWQSSRRLRVLLPLLVGIGGADLYIFNRLRLTSSNPPTNTKNE